MPVAPDEDQELLLYATTTAEQARAGARHEARRENHQHRDGEEADRHAARRLWTRRPAPWPGSGDRVGDEAPPYTRRHADRRGQVALLSIARPAPARHDHRRQSADRVDERPARQADAARRAGRAGE